MHEYKEIRNSGSDEFIGYVAITGQKILCENNIECSNYYIPEYESQFTDKTRKNIMVLPILNADGQGLCGVLEIVGYSQMSKEGYLED